MTADLERHGIAHGDLQHGNLLVAADGTFRLVDYDGMYVPALRGEGEPRTATATTSRPPVRPPTTAPPWTASPPGPSNWPCSPSPPTPYSGPTPRQTRRVPDPVRGGLQGTGDLTGLARPAEPPGPAGTGRGRPGQGLPRQTGVRPAAPDRRRRDAPGATDGTASVSGAGDRAGRVRGATGPEAAWAQAVPRSRPGRRPVRGPRVRGRPGWRDAWPPPAPTPASTPPPERQPAAAGHPRVRRARRRAPGPGRGGRRAASTPPGGLVLAAAQPVDVLPAAQGLARLTSAALVGYARRRRPEYRAARKRVRDLKRRSRELADPASAHQRLEKEIRVLDDALAKDNTASDQRIQALQLELRDGQARITMDLNRVRTRPSSSWWGWRRRSSGGSTRRWSPRSGRTSRTSCAGRRSRRRCRSNNMGSKMVQALQDAGIHSAADFIGVDFCTTRPWCSWSASAVSDPGTRHRRGAGPPSSATGGRAWSAGPGHRTHDGAAGGQGPDQGGHRRAPGDPPGGDQTGGGRGPAEEGRVAATDHRRTRSPHGQRQQRAMDTQRKRAELLQRQKQLAGAGRNGHGSRPTWRPPARKPGCAGRLAVRFL